MHDLPILCAGFVGEEIVCLAQDGTCSRWRLTAGGNYANTRRMLPRGPSVRSALCAAAARLHRGGAPDPRLAAELLVASILRIPRHQLHSTLGRSFSASRRRRLRILIGRALRGEPTCHLTGEREFYGLSFRISSAVLAPRGATETIVDLVLEDLKSRGGTRSMSSVHIADICTGSGCVGLSLLKLVPGSTCSTVDISEPALRIARLNAARLRVSGRIRFFRGDMLTPLLTRRNEGSLDYLVSNPPYVADAEWGDVDKAVLQFEPHLALRGGPDGLDLIRPLLAGAPRLLRPGGLLAIEISEWHNGLALALARRTPGLTQAEIVNDGYGMPIHDAHGHLRHPQPRHRHVGARQR